MAVKFLTTKKHSKTAKLIQKSKDEEQAKIKAEQKTKEEEQAKIKAEQKIKRIKKAVKKEPKVKPIKQVVKKVVKKEPKVKHQGITNKQYLDALLIVARYERENPKMVKPELYINLFEVFPIRVVNSIRNYFLNKGITIEPKKVEVAKIKKIDLEVIALQRNFGKVCVEILKEFLNS